MPTKSDRSSHITLVLGGTRSGKSSFAQRLAEQNGDKLVYIATAEAFDDEMTDRIARHQQDRGEQWHTVEETLDLATIITTHSAQKTTLLIDCLTIWLSNVMLADRNIATTVDGLAQSISNAPGPVILVSNEVGSGIVPESALGREFRDESGWMNQRIAAAADDVALITAGLPQWLKRDGA
ncbi:bifunctional adenosylcobinamide kinase/adenosylcobinamide-phosphate guanylyltransferase [Parasphingorhabdus cellanae]|uniref:Bifunctional adenosylcobalamin biosynthesis protein n=1 Tax=Parasphingorhabdus cellanae TaxID=2806553 RepID=A0ABX7T5B1_9SPHN|nr:bifunctional adenosylcobinamide kinase/adenosylcobinamide-phosphate guanylyltransferase [Parasphingorhabdus cellanae]QTD56770.1 bifunctional adenosylcobinamide kinase/adenosylcobinamide-phosphate guanylyltransferase [Parasphingorhabdus cellanae]